MKEVSIISCPFCDRDGFASVAANQCSEWCYIYLKPWAIFAVEAAQAQKGVKIKSVGW